QYMVARLAEELVAHHVERRHAFRAATRNVERGEVERQAEQVVAQRAGDELINLVADLGDRAERQLTGGILAGIEVGERIGEGGPQGDVGRNRIAVRVEQDRMPAGVELARPIEGISGRSLVD